MRRGCSRRLWIVPAAALLLACGTLTVPQERRLGEEFARQVGGEVSFIYDKVVIDYVRRIGLAVLAAAGPQPFEYRFYVVKDDAINAFAGPGGHIYFHTGVILKARDVSELAGVVAHEVGHVVKRHIAQNYNRQRTTGLLYQLGVLTAGILGGGAVAQMANLGGGLAATAYLNSFTRDAEREADAFAIEVLPQAGYDPDGMVTFFQTLLREGGGGGAPEFLSSHPTTKERIENARELIAALPARSGLRVHDSGRLEIVQRRIELLTGRRAPRR